MLNCWSSRLGDVGTSESSDLEEQRSPAGLTAVRVDAAARATVGVLHPWWGLTGAVTDRCRELAREGYLAVAPDLYRGEVADTPEQAERLRRKRRDTPAWRHIVAVLQAARTEQAPGSRIGLIGYSMGGHWALWLSSQARPEVPAISATVVYYATRACDFHASAAALQIHLAESDTFVSASGVAALERALGTAGRPHELHRYPGTGHWFAEHDRPDAFQPAAAALAWDRTLAFLRQHLLT
jgi:carboxymethylenebutenolidase